MERAARRPQRRTATPVSTAPARSQRHRPYGSPEVAEVRDARDRGEDRVVPSQPARRHVARWPRGARRSRHRPEPHGIDEDHPCLPFRTVLGCPARTGQPHRFFDPNLRDQRTGRADYDSTATDREGFFLGGTRRDGARRRGMRGGNVPGNLPTTLSGTQQVPPVTTTASGTTDISARPSRCPSAATIVELPDASRQRLDLRRSGHGRSHSSGGHRVRTDPRS
jgi:hypothetical protein